MIGQLDSSDRRVMVVGAGAAGLLIADALDRAGWEVRLCERAARAGGLIATRETPFGPAETAAHSLLVTPAARALFQRLGIALDPVRGESRARHVLRQGRMRRMPLGPLEALGAFARAYFVVSRAPEGQTLGEWANRHLGAAAREYLLTPFVRGVYGANPEDLDLALAFPALSLPRGHSLLSYRLHLLRTRKSRPARPALMAPRQGMGAFVDALTDSLRARLAARFELGCALDEPPPGTGNVVLAVPTSEAARLLAQQDPALADALRSVTYTELTSVTAFVESAVFRGSPPRGIGVLIPRRETERKILGVLFNSSAFPGRAKEGYESFTVMLAQPHSALEDGELRALVERELGVIFRAPGLALAHAEISRWPRAIPRYDRALGEALARARAGWCAQPGHVLFGNYAGQVSLRGMIETASALPGPK